VIALAGSGVNLVVDLKAGTGLLLQGRLRPQVVHGVPPRVHLDYVGLLGSYNLVEGTEASPAPVSLPSSIALVVPRLYSGNTNVARMRVEAAITFRFRIHKFAAVGTVGPIITINRKPEGCSPEGNGTGSATGAVPTVADANGVILIRREGG